MEVGMRVAKWGNSLAVRIPVSVVEEMGLKEGDELRVRFAAKGELELAAKPDLETMLARVRKLRGRIPADFKFDREEANSRG
jgi:antitoxin MazE